MLALFVALFGALYAAEAIVRGHRALRRLAPRGVERVVASAEHLEGLSALARSANELGVAPTVIALVERAASAESVAEARFEVDAYLAELDEALRRAAAPLTAHGRVAMTVGTFGAILELIGGVHDPSRALPYALGALGVGALGAMSAAQVSRRALAEAQQHRASYDRVVGALARWL